MDAIHQLDGAQHTGFEQDIEIVLANPALKQHIVRTETDNVDRIVAYVRCGFQPGQQRQILHFPIYPAMEGIPNVQAMGVDESIRLRVTDNQKFGVRLEILLDEVASEPIYVLVELVISSPNEKPK